MSAPALRAALCAGAFAFAALASASAHEIVGNRFFPATLAVDDPGVNDELAFPTISKSKTADDPPFKQLDISGEFSKRITEDFAIAVAPTWSKLFAPGGANMTGARGFQNLETSLKYRMFKNPEHEFVMSVGLEIEWGRTGAQQVGADVFTAYTPTVYFGKGFGDLPDSLRWAKPFAITGQIGYSIPSARMTDDDVNPRVLEWGGSLQYSLPYLRSSVVDIGLPEFFNHLIPIVEFAMETPVGNTLTSGTLTTGTVNPGVIWVGRYYQVGLEAVVPVNRQSGSSVGGIAQVHFFLDDIFPDSIGKPIFGSSVAARKPMMGN